jgi:undecaprenyl-diphosphatase
VGAQRASAIASLPPLDRRGRGRLLVAAGTMLGLVVALYGWLQLVGPLPGDRAVTHWWSTWKPWTQPGDVRNLLSFFDSLATPWVAAATVVAFMAVVAENLGRRWALLVPAAAAVVVLNATLKQVFGPTPLWQGMRHLGLNFPSGHVAYVTAVFGVAAWTAWRCGQRAIAASCVALIVLMGIDRVIARAHLPSDVLAGYLVGGAWLCLVLAVLRPSGDRR